MFKDLKLGISIIDKLTSEEIKSINDLMRFKIKRVFDKMLDPEVIAKYGKTQDERMAINKYIRVFKALIGEGKIK